MTRHFFYKLLGISCIIAVLEICGLGIAIIDQTGTKVFSSFKAEQLPPIFIVEMLVFTGIVVGLHCLVLIYSWLSARALLVKGKLSQDAAENFGLLVLLISWICIFLLNNAFIPRSIFSYWGEYAIGPINQTNLALACALLAALPLTLIGWWALAAIKPAPIAALIILALSIPSTLLLTVKKQSIEASPDKPNIITIGIDSFRPEYLHSRQLMPTLSRLLADSAVFTNVYTPLARTFPSWTSMLSGLHPVETGARINLTDPKLIRRDAMITWQLRKAGYHTVLATDERRFSNLDESYGFDTVFGPKTGAADFVLGLAGDIPLVNLLASTPLGDELFPHLYNNRAVSRLYRPEQFAENLGRELSQGPNSPMFMMSHLCLPHWPYDWASAALPGQKKPPVLKPSSSNTSPGDKLRIALERRTHVYESALQEVDKQIAILLQSLHKSGHLDNAIVVILSDHGEGLGWPEEALVGMDNGDMPISAKRRGGHGSNIFALGQHHTFMAFKRYGAAQYPPGDRQQRFANYDFKPTLLDLLGIPATETSRAVSMVPWIKNLQRDELDRAIFVETGLHVPAIDKLSISTGEVLSQGASFYKLGNDGRLVIHPEQLEQLIENKQRGILKGQLLLGQVPTRPKNAAMQYEWILADIRGGNAVKLIASNFDSECHAACLEMMSELKDFYGDELKLDTWTAYTASAQEVHVADRIRR